MKNKLPTTFIAIITALLGTGIAVHILSSDVLIRQDKPETSINTSNPNNSITEKPSAERIQIANQELSESIPKQIKKDNTEESLPTTKEKVGEKVSYAGLFGRLEKLKSCSKGLTDCDLPQTDPRSAELELGQRIAKTIDVMTLLSQSSSEDNEQYHQIAQEYVKHHDGHVQESALELMATLNPNPDNVKALIEGLNNTHDAKIYNMSLIEFSRHTDPQLKSEIDTLLVNTLTTGGHFASQEVAKNILPLLNDDNIEKYRQVLEQIQPTSDKAKSLKANIEEYDLQQSGG
mgnify:CR=1 FL=1